MTKAVYLAPLVLLTFMMLSSAAYVSIVEPFNATVQNNEGIFIGKVGPGQTFYITISATTKNSTGSVFELGWNELRAASAPSGWIVENSSLYNQYPSVKLTVAPYAENGTYRIDLSAINVGNYSKLGAVNFHVYVNVTPDVFGLSVSPTSIEAGIGQPAPVYVLINNTGVSDSPFVISAQGLPAWSSNSTIIALHHTAQSFVYPIYESTPGVYNATLRVSSVASPLIYRQSGVTLTVRQGVLNDYAALGQGALAFPIVYEPVYAIMYLISLLFKK